jgi:hypothetical protein
MGGSAPGLGGSQPGYGGPAILSRSSGTITTRAGELFRIQPFIQFSGIYDSNLSGVIVSPTGGVPFTSGFGGELGFGAYGFRSWRRTLLGLNYRGALRHYNRQTYYDGFDNFLGLRLTHQPKRHVAFSLGQSLASYSNQFFLPITGSTFYDPAFATITSEDLSNNRTHVLMSNATVAWQKSRRLTLSASGVGFVVKRRSRSLIGASGYGAGGNIAYRLSRYQTIGLDYTYDHFGFRRFFSSTDLHGLGMNYSIQLGRNWTFGLRAGAYRIAALGLQQVPVDPYVAAILGQDFAVATFYKVVYLPNLAGNLSRRFRRATWSLQYARSVSPGNGVYLTSGTESASISYNYAGFRRLNLDALVGSNTYNAVTQTIGKYRSYNASGGVSYSLRRQVALTLRFDARQYRIGGTGFNRIFYHGQIGVAFSPGDIPFSLW